MGEANVAVGVGRGGIELDRRGEVVQRFAVFPLELPHIGQSSPIIGVGGGLELDSRAVVLERLRNLAEHLHGLGAEEIGFGLLRLAPDDFARVLHGLRVSPEEVEAAGARAIGGGVVAVLPEERIEGLEGLLIAAAVGFSGKPVKNAGAAGQCRTAGVATADGVAAGSS